MDGRPTGDVNAIIKALNVLRLPAAPGEYDIHALVGAALEKAGIQAQHEASLGRGCRIDFLCGETGIEVKKGKIVRASLKKQLERYAASEKISALIVVAPGDAHMPRVIGGVPVNCVALGRLWGVALP